MKTARDWQAKIVQSKQLGGDFVPPLAVWIEAIQRDALEAALVESRVTASHDELERAIRALMPPLRTDTQPDQ